MYSDLNNPALNAIVASRLDRIRQALPGLSYSTREELLAQIYSLVNRAVQLGSGATPIVPVAAGTPAKPGDLLGNFQAVNTDTEDFTKQLEAVTGQITAFYNLSGTVENRLRQMIRDAAYASSPTQWQEGFVNTTQVASTDANVDYTVGLLTLPVMATTAVVSDSTILGGHTVGTVNGTTDLLLDGSDLTVLSASGPGAALELIWTFATPVIANRLQAFLDDFSGYQVTTWVVSPDGVQEYDLLGDLLPGESMWGADSGKLSGTVVMRFRPRSFVRMRMVITDHAQSSRVALRGIELSREEYATAGSWVSQPFTLSANTAQFLPTGWSSPPTNPLVSISHQISNDGINFRAITPGEYVATTSALYYKASLSRNDKLLSQQSTTTFAADPASTAGYTLTSSYTTPLDGQVFQRVLQFSTGSGPLVLAEAVLTGSLSITSNGTTLASSLYTFSNNTLDLLSAQTNLAVTYQTRYTPTTQTPLGSYFTPLVSLIQFRKSA